MSRVGKAPVVIPQGVDIAINGQDLTVKGKLGELKMDLARDVSVEVKDGKAVVAAKTETQQARRLWATTRAILASMVKGVSQGYSRKMEINGVGYRAAMQGKDLVLQLGYSHEVRFPLPAGIKIECPSQTEIIVNGFDKQKVGQVAAEIRSFRPPEPYKGKGIKYAGEQILRKEGKKK